MVFMVKMLMMHGICLSILLGIHLSLIRLVVFMVILFLIFVHFMQDRIMPPFCCGLCGSSDHNIVTCPFYACYANPDSSFPLAQCMGFEVGDPFGLIAKFDVGHSYCALEDTLNVVHNLVNML